MTSRILGGCVLLLLTITVRGEINCPGPLNCSCSQSPNSYELHCPYEYPLLTVQIKLNQYVHLQCAKTDNPDVYSLLNGLEIGNVTRFKMVLCPLPKTSIKTVMNNMGVSKINFLQIQSYSNMSDTFTKQHLEGLNDLKDLYLSMNGLTSLPENVFQDNGNLTWLDLKNNYINLPKGIFRYVPKLEILELGSNNLTHLEPGIFRNLIHLRLLNLWGNRLTNLSRSVFTDIPNLTMLDLTSNQMTSIRPDLFADLVNLENLKLYGNDFVSLPSGLFLSNTKLQTFDLQQNRRTLKTLPNGLLANLTKLNLTKMSGCNLTSLPEDLIWGSTFLTELALDQNLLNTLPEKFFIDSSHLEKLNLANNRIEFLPDRLFEKTTKLKTLRLEKNLLVTIPEKLFSNLVNLEYLDLRYNKLSHIEPKAFVELTVLKILNMSNNFLNLMTDNQWPDEFGPRSPFQSCLALEDLQLANNAITEVFTDWRIGMPSLKTINLSYNNISKLDMQKMRFNIIDSLMLDVSYNNITTIDMYEAERIADELVNSTHPSLIHTLPVVNVNINGNHLNCDCRLYPLLQYFEDELSPAVRYILNIIPGNASCAEPRIFRDSPLPTVPSRLLTCQFENSTCPKHCVCLFRTADKALIVNCERSNLNYIPNSLPVYNYTNHTEVYLSYNNIVKFPTVLGTGYDRVTKYLLADNYISNINLTILSPNLQVLDLSGNNLTRLDDDSINFLHKAKSLQNVSLYNNPWECDCYTMTFVNYLKDQYKRVNSLNNITCGDERPIVQVPESELCPMSDEIIYITSISIILLIFFICMTIVAIYYRFQKEIKVWLYAHNFCLWFVSEEELDQDKLYDAFISYSHEDEDFVVNHLVPQLENGPIKYKLCLHYRDWVVGEFIPNQIVRTVEDSRRTVIVLSPNFLKSVWGRMEFRAAHSQALSEGRARVILILYNDIGPTDNLDEELKAYLSLNTYVKWGDPWFWDKLRYALPHPAGLSKSIPLIKPSLQKSKPTLNLSDKSGLMNGTDPNATPPAVTTPPANSLIIDPLQKPENGHIKTIS